VRKLLIHKHHPGIHQEIVWLFRALGYARPYRWFLLVILLLTLTVAATNVIEPLFLKYIFDSLGGDGVLQAVTTGVAALIGLALLREGAGALSNYLSWRTRILVQYGLQDAMVERIHQLPQDYHRNEGVGAVMTRLDRSIQGFVTAISEFSFNMLPAFAYLIMAIVVMSRLDWRLTLLVVFFAPLPAIIASRAAPVQIQRERNLLNRWTRIYSRFNEVLSGIVTVRSFAMEDKEKERFLKGVREANGVVINGVWFDSWISASQNLVVTVARIAAIGLGGLLIMKGETTLGTLVAFLSYVGGLFGPVQGLTGIYRNLRTASVSLEQVFTILDTQDYLGDAPDAVELKSLRGDISFRNVHFTYRASSHKVLRGIDLDVSAGEMVAIVGPSGSGKSTLMALLQRFYDPSEGVIRLDGTDIRSIKQKSLRRNIGVVLQDALLFNESVRDNIAYSRPGARFEEVVSAAEAANAHNFILNLEHEYDTPLGERGSRLSFGERQRIAIARAILRDPPIVILDEATSALDAETEALVQDALERLIKGRTTFVIAHRLATVVNADRIVVLNRGRIIESGRHCDLLAHGGYYASLVERQTRRLITPS
jgi:ATP-binding cassette subfamily B protein